MFTYSSRFRSHFHSHFDGSLHFRNALTTPRSPRQQTYLFTSPARYSPVLSMAPRRQKKGGSTGAVAATPVRRSSRIQGLPAPIDSVNRATQPSKRRTLARRLEPRISLSLSPSPPLYVRKSTTPPTRSTPSLHSPAPAAASRIVASSSKTRHHQQQQHHDDSPGEEIGSHGYQFPHSNELDVATDSDIRPSIEYDIVQVDEQTDDNNPSYLVGEQPDSYDSYGSGANQAIHDDSPHRVDKPTSKNDTAPLDFDQADDSGPDDRRNMRADYGTGDDNEAGATSAHQDGADLQDQPQNNHDEARNFLRLTLSVQRRTDVQPQDIELHFYDDWTQLGSDRTLIMKFDAAEGGSRKRRRNLVDVAGEQFAEESEASPLEQVASPPERFLKRRRISRDSTAAEEQDSIAFCKFRSNRDSSNFLATLCLC